MTHAARLLALFAVLGALTVASLGSAVPAAAATGDIGYQDQSYAPLGGSPTGTKPESKLWFNNRWWATMFNPAAGEHHIYKLNAATGGWSDTGVAIDPRDSTRADTLWDPAAGKLYVASHVYTTSGTAASSGSSGRLYRYSYNAATDRYSLDSGFPVTVNAAKSETLVIDRDSTGMLWATWTQNSRVYVNHSVGGNDASWGTPYIVPGAGTSLTSDDISSLIHFGGNKVGVMWSNQTDGHVYFAIHVDGTGDSSSDWSTSVVPTGASSDDHINLKADSAGRVYAAVKTSETSSTRPLILLLVRSTSAVWTVTTFGSVANSQTRPIVLLDEQHGVIHMFATCPQPPKTSGQSGGDICEKTTSMASPSFSSGIGTAVISEAGVPDMNDATSTKQNVNSTTGIVLMANNATSDTYWHMQESLGDSTPPPPPPSGGSSTQTFLPVADAQVKSTSPSTNYGTLSTIRVRQGTSPTDVFYHSYLTFTVSGLAGPVTGAKLRLLVEDPSPDGGQIYQVAPTWSESTIRWSNAPELLAPPMASIGATPAIGSWAEVNLGSLITGDGTYSIGIASTSSNSAIYSSREGTGSPQLVVSTG